MDLLQSYIFSISQSLTKNRVNKLRMHIVSGHDVTAPIYSSVGVPEGDCLSPILFALFISDVEEYLHHRAPVMGGSERKSIFFADDGAIIAISAEELQKGLDGFAEYCKKNQLSINAEKTKVMVFGRGWIPKADFIINGERIEVVREFKYLGVILSPQLSFSSHLQACASKAKARISYLYLKLPLLEMPLDLVIQIFNTYILQIFMYCAPIWVSRVTSKNAIQQLNAVFSNFIKRYLGLPKYVSNSAVHYYCGTWPLFSR